MFRCTFTIRGPEGVSAQGISGKWVFLLHCFDRGALESLCQPLGATSTEQQICPPAHARRKLFYWMVTGCTKQAPILFACCSSFKYYLLTHFTPPHYPTHSSVGGTQVV